MIVNKRITIFLLVFISLLLATITVVCSKMVMAEYYNHNSFFYDPVMTYSKSIDFYSRMMQESNLNPITSRINFVAIQFVGNPKSFLFYLPTILFYPILLSTPWAVTPAIALMMGLFLFTLAYSMFIRKNSLILIISVLVLASSASVYFTSFRGLSSGWFDLPTSFLLTSSLICLVNWHQYRKLMWLVWCGVFVGLAMLARSIFAVNAILLIVPTFFYSSITYYKQSKNLMNAIIKPGFLLMGIIIALAGYYHWIHFENNLFYYTHISNTGKVGSIYESFISFLKLGNVIGLTYTIGLILSPFVLYLLYRKLHSIVNKQNIKIILMILLIMPLFWVIYYKMGDKGHHVYLTILPLFFIVFILFEKSIDLKINKKLILFSVILFVFSSVNFSFAFKKNLNQAKHPDIFHQDTKKLDGFIANKLFQLNKTDLWTAFFDDYYTRIPNCECFYKFKKSPQFIFPVEQVMLNQYLKSYYPNWSDEQIHKYNVSNLNKIKLMVIFDSDADVDKGMSEGCNRAKIITKKMIAHLKSDPLWIKKETYHSLKYGVLAFYYKQDSSKN